MLTIAIFAISTFAIVNPVAAHFTLGDLTGTFRYHANDFDPHVSGVIGYVWPGGGQNAYSGFPNYATNKFSPGYQSPYPGGKPGVTPGSSGNAPSSSWYQLEGDAYAPFGAVLTGSTGDLIFALNATADYTGSWDTLVILIPPGFSVSNTAASRLDINERLRNGRLHGHCGFNNRPLRQVRAKLDHGYGSDRPGE